jgi:transposase IS116/IS110/IS902 family protein
LSTDDDGSRSGPNHLECCGGGDRQWCRLHAGGAWLGLVQKQESTGDRTILGKISKRGNKYLRTLFVQAAHVVLARRPNAAMRGLWPWIEHYRGGCTGTCWRSRLPTSLPASLGRFSRAGVPISREDRCRCRVIQACSGSPMGCPPPLSATVAHNRVRASDGGSEGMASRHRFDIKTSERRLSSFTIDSFPAEVCEME